MDKNELVKNKALKNGETQNLRALVIFNSKFIIIDNKYIVLNEDVAMKNGGVF